MVHRSQRARRQHGVARRDGDGGRDARDGDAPDRGPEPPLLVDRWLRRGRARAQSLAFAFTFCGEAFALLALELEALLREVEPAGLRIAAGSFALAVLGQDYLLDLELSALHTEGKGEVIASPRVITANQREALIRQGDEVGYVTIAPQAGGNTIPIPNVQFKEVLLELKVTPTITQDQRVFLTMNVKKDEVSGFIDTSIGSVPQINKREINTAVLVENGQTVVLGGVYEFKSRKDLTKVPFLGDIPAVGNLFKTKSRSTDKAELLIFVTPKILEQTRR